LTVGAGLSLPGLSAATRPAPQGFRSGARLFVAPMEWNLDGFIAAEIQKQGLPVQLVVRREEAQLVMTSLYQGLGSHLIAPGHYIQVKIVSADGGKQVWFAEANDYAIFFGRLRQHGPGRAAKWIVKRISADFYEGGEGISR